MDGPTAATVIRDGKYSFNTENGPIAGSYNVRILQTPKREGPAGKPRKDAPRVNSASPAGGWTFKADVRKGQSAKLDFRID